MHSTSSIYTRQRMGIDNNVWISMLTCVVLSAGLLGYNVTNHNKVKPCNPVEILVNGRKNTDSAFFKTGDVLSFRSAVSTGDRIIWDFGDETRKEEGFAAAHVFTRGGGYTVRAMVNNQCWFDKRITVENASLVMTDTADNIFESITGKEEANTGEKLVFSTMLPASDYNWSVENNGNYKVQNGKQASFTFATQGNYTIVLMLDHNQQKHFVKTVTITKPAVTGGGAVAPSILIRNLPRIADTADKGKPVEPQKAAAEVVKKKFKYLTDDALKDYLQDMVCNGMKPADFNDILCQGANTPVIINNKSRKTFADLCGEIVGKKTKIESVTANRDADNCVNTLTVTYDKKGFLGKNPCRN